MIMRRLKLEAKLLIAVATMLLLTFCTQPAVAGLKENAHYPSLIDARRDAVRIANIVCAEHKEKEAIYTACKRRVLMNDYSYLRTSEGYLAWRSITNSESEARDTN